MQQLSMAHQQTCQDLYAMQQQAVTLRTAVDLLHTLAGLPIPQQLTGEARWQVLMDVASGRKLCVFYVFLLYGLGC